MTKFALENNLDSVPSTQHGAALNCRQLQLQGSDTSGLCEKLPPPRPPYTHMSTQFKINLLKRREREKNQVKVT